MKFFSIFDYMNDLTTSSKYALSHRLRYKCNSYELYAEKVRFFSAWSISCQELVRDKSLLNSALSGKPFALWSSLRMFWTLLRSSTNIISLVVTSSICSSEFSVRHLVCLCSINPDSWSLAFNCRRSRLTTLPYKSMLVWTADSRSTATTYNCE